MDDILSAALGQSGLNSSFLENQDGDNGGFAGTEISPIVNIPTHIKSIVPSQNTTYDIGDDLTEFLCMLTDSVNDIKQSTTLIANGNNVGNKPITSLRSSEEIATDVGENEMINYFFKSDDEEESVPSPAADNSSVLFHPINMSSMFQTQKSQRVPSLSAQFPKLVSAKTVVTLPSMNNSEFSQNQNIINNTIKTKGGKQTISSDFSTFDPLSPRSVIMNTPNKTIKKVLIRKSSSPGTGKPPFVNPKSPSDIEKKRQSIQKVLASPNLTAREKQFIMKSAISHNINAEISQLPSSPK